MTPGQESACPDLVSWLRAQLDAVERITTRSEHYCDCRDLGCEDDQVRDVAHDAVSAHRAILELHEGSHECSQYDHAGEVDRCTWVHEGDVCSTVRLLGAIFALRPGYRSEWAPG